MDLTLRQLNESDIDLVGRWLTLPHVAKWFKTPEAWIEEIKPRKTEFSFIRHFIVCVDGKDIGFCQYYDYSKGGENWHGNISMSGTYSIDYMIGEPDYIGKGYGTKLLTALTESVWKEPDAKRIIAQPEPENFASRSTLLSAGFSYIKDFDLFIL